eukprot:1158166-Pelagomonas_calceolata.AAC.1
MFGPVTTKEGAAKVSHTHQGRGIGSCYRNRKPHTPRKKGQRQLSEALHNKHHLEWRLLHTRAASHSRQVNWMASAVQTLTLTHECKRS